MRSKRGSGALWAVSIGAMTAVSMAGCLSSGPARALAPVPPAAEPAVSPPVTTSPAGIVVPAGPDAEGIAVDPATAVVAVGISSGVVLFDEAGRLRHSVHLAAGPRHISIMKPGGPFLVPEQGADQLAFVDPVSGSVEGVIPTGRWPHDVAVADGTVFVGNELGNSITIVRRERVIAIRPVVTQPGGLAVVGRLLAAVGVRARRLELLDTGTWRRVDEVPAQTGPSHVVSYGQSLYLVDTGGGALLVYSVHPRLHQTARLALPRSPLGIAVDPNRRRLWITATATNTLVEFDLSRGEPHQVATYPTVRQPDSVGVDTTTGMVFVTGADSGQLEILSS